MKKYFSHLTLKMQTYGSCVIIFNVIIIVFSEHKAFVGLFFMHRPKQFYFLLQVIL